MFSVASLLFTLCDCPCMLVSFVLFVCIFCICLFVVICVPLYIKCITLPCKLKGNRVKVARRLFIALRYPRQDRFRYGPLQAATETLPTQALGRPCIVWRHTTGSTPMTVLKSVMPSVDRPPNVSRTTAQKVTPEPRTPRHNWHAS